MLQVDVVHGIGAIYQNAPIVPIIHPGTSFGVCVGPF